MYFINHMYSCSLFPLILKPSRITIDTATLIDNIFTNEIDSEISSGLLINDISDHLPVFAIFHNFFKNTNDPKQNTLDFKRIKTQETIAALNADLSTQDWKTVYVNKDPNKAYEAFLSILLELYNKNCPLRKQIVKYKHRNRPWITRGIENACKKKNLLYKNFLKHRTKETEIRYKTYKNKLVNIIRSQKKEHYQTLLEKHRSDTKGIWRVINSAIRKEEKHR